MLSGLISYRISYLAPAAEPYNKLSKNFSENQTALDIKNFQEPIKFEFKEDSFKDDIALFDNLKSRKKHQHDDIS